MNALAHSWCFSSMMFSQGESYFRGTFALDILCDDIRTMIHRARIVRLPGDQTVVSGFSALLNRTNFCGNVSRFLILEMNC